MLSAPDARPRQESGGPVAYYLRQDPRSRSREREDRTGWGQAGRSTARLRSGAFGEPVHGIETRQQIDRDRRAPVPVGRYLEDRRTRQTTVREQHIFAKAAFAARDLHVHGDSGQIAVTRDIVWCESQRV